MLNSIILNKKIHNYINTLHTLFQRFYGGVFHSPYAPFPIDKGKLSMMPLWGIMAHFPICLTAVFLWGGTRPPLYPPRSTYIRGSDSVSLSIMIVETYKDGFKQETTHKYKLTNINIKYRSVNFLLKN